MTTDPVLDLLQELRRIRDEADHRMRLVLAFAREFTTPRPYRLADLAEASGLSISGIRTAYGDAERAELTDLFRKALGDNAPPSSRSIYQLGMAWHVTYRSFQTNRRDACPYHVCSGCNEPVAALPPDGHLAEVFRDWEATNLDWSHLYTCTPLCPTSRLPETPLILHDPVPCTSTPGCNCPNLGDSVAPVLRGAELDA